MNKVPSFNIFIMQPPMMKEERKKSSPLLDALRRKEQADTMNHMEMMNELRNVTGEIKGLPHLALAGGG